MVSRYCFVGARHAGKRQLMNHIVLYHPEIPQNTGNIMRTCVATNMKLHLIEPLGFKLSSKYVKRSAVNYLEHLDYKVYPDWDAFVQENKGTFVFLTRYGTTSPDKADLRSHSDLYLIFGKESTGIPKEILRDHLDACYRLPMTANVRSLNLSNTVAIVAYEALRQQGYPNLSTHEPETMKGKDYLTREEN